MNIRTPDFFPDVTQIHLAAHTDLCEDQQPSSRYSLVKLQIQRVSAAAMVSLLSGVCLHCIDGIVT